MSLIKVDLTNQANTKEMNKSDLVEVHARQMGITYSDAERGLNNLINIIYNELRQGGKVNISGFGQFSVSHRESRMGVNPRQPTERITIPELNTPKFKAGEAFKAAVALKQ